MEYQISLVDLAQSRLLLVSTYMNIIMVVSDWFIMSPTSLLPGMSGRDPNSDANHEETLV
jgi:hypothetical protein